MIKYSSIQPETMADKKRLASALESSNYKATDFREGGKPFHVEHAVIHDVEINGEPVDRLVLINEKGETLAFVSEGVVSSFNRLRDIFGELPWKPALPIVVREIQTRNGYRTYNLHVVD